MLIVHATGHSLVRFTPGRISSYWGRYTEHRGRAVCLGRGGGRDKYREPLNPQGIWCVQRDHRDFERLVAEADVLHCHDDAYPTKISGWDKVPRLIYHAHIGDVPKKMRRGMFRYNKKRVRHACITNGYGRHFDEEERSSGVKWGRLPDILDINHPTFLPRPDFRSANDKFTAVFTYSNAYEMGHRINAKCPRATRALLKGKLPGVDLRLIHGYKFEACMAEKQRAHIVLDELFSPYTHLSTLEGASVGACVLTAFDDYTAQDLCRVLGCPVESLPFVRVNPQNVVDTILYYRDHPDEAEAIGRRSRSWMEEWYDPRRLLELYLRFYDGS